MVDHRRIGLALGRALLRAIQVALAGLLLFSVWVLGDLPSGPDPPEQAGTFVWAFLFAWGFAAFSLAGLVGAELLVGGYRRWSAGAPPDRRTVGRLASEVLLGLAVVALAPPLEPTAGTAVLLAPAVLAWAVLVHVAADVVLYGRRLAGAG